VRVTAVSVEDRLCVFLIAEVTAVKIRLSMSHAGERGDDSECQSYAGHCGTAIHLDLLKFPETVGSTVGGLPRPGAGR
jgi:hypothetical protein